MCWQWQTFATIASVTAGSGAVECDRRIVDRVTVVGRRVLLADCELHRQHARKLRCLPRREHPIEHAGIVRRVGERDVPPLFGERIGELYRITFVDAALRGQPKERDIGLERMQAARPRFHEVTVLRAARDRFKPKRTCASEKIEDASPCEFRLELVEQGGPDALGGRTYPKVIRRRQVATCVLS